MLTENTVNKLIEAPDYYCGCKHDDEGNESVVKELFFCGPYDLLKIALHLTKPLADSLKEAGFSIVFLDGGDSLCGGGSDFLFFSHFHASFQTYLVSTCLVCFLQKGQYLLRSKRSEVFFLFLTVL